MIVLNDTLGAYGGSHTMMLRMCTWLRENDIKVTIVCSSMDNTEIVEKLEKTGTNIVCADMSDAKKGYFVLKELLDIEDIKVFNFSWNYYLDMECIKKIHKLRFDNFVYCIHPETFKKGIGFKSEILRQYSINKYKKIYERMNTNGALIMMDEINTEESGKYLQVNLQTKPPIVCLPMYCSALSNKDEVIKSGFESDVIMTAARADFPYKGYIIGLIKAFENIKKSFPNTQLEIISAGEDYDQILFALDQLPASVRNSIKLHGWMDYDTLKENIKRCKVFVGMGTTVLDSSLLYKPSVAVRFNTYDLIGDSLIADKPTYFTAMKDCKENATNQILRVLNMDYEEYKKCANKSFDEVEKNYAMKYCMDALITSNTKEKRSILTTRETYRHIVNNIINRIRFRKNHFDYKSITKE